MRAFDLVSLFQEMTVSGTVCAGYGLLFFAWFFLPVVTGRILNIGNVTGLVVSACLFFYGCRQARIHRFLSGLWQQGGLPVRAVLAAAGLVLAAAAVTALVLTCMIVRASLRRPAPEADVIVLGCEVKGERPSLMLLSRMDAAAAYLQDHPGVRCVVSGGRGDGEKIPEALCMFRYLTEKGVDPARILQEDRSVSTRENLLFSVRMLREAEKREVQSIAVVTNEFHACRAHLIARSMGLEAGTVPAATPWWLLPTFYVRELYGILYQLFL